MILVLATLAPWIAPYDPLEQNLYHTLNPPSKQNLLGTDHQGRDILSRVLYGARISLLVSIASVLIGAFVGVFAGMFAAYSGGKIGSLIMRSVDIMMCFPTLVLGIAVMALLGSGLLKVVFCIAIVMSPRFTRIAYGSTLSVKNAEYIEAARSINVCQIRMFLLHILPNIFGEILVVGILWMGTAMQIEASLSFIGIGVPPPIPTWGNMIRTGMEFLPIASSISIAPGVAIFITILSLNILADGMRDISDPKLYKG
jgi:peptide/nickel transport system permease protein